MSQDWSYLTRPAKWVERHVILDTLLKLSSKIELDSHQYVGMGGLEFVDFQLFHRSLGISDMISIERNTTEKERYESNVPFSCVRIEYGDSAEVLPSLPFDEGPSIVWLDYQDPLTSALLAEIVDTALRLQVGSVLIVTLNAEPGRASGRADRFKQNLGEELINRYVGDPKSADLTRALLPGIQSTILREEIDAACEPTTTSFRLLDVAYRDNASMQTVGMVMDDASHEVRRAIEEIDWSGCAYAQRALDPEEGTTLLKPPFLTARERQALDQVLPTGDIDGEADRLGLARDIAREYASMYRWYPRYVSASMAS